LSTEVIPDVGRGGRISTLHRITRFTAALMAMEGINVYAKAFTQSSKSSLRLNLHSYRHRIT